MAAEEKADASTAASSVATAPASSGGKMLPILTALNLLATIGMVAVLFVSFQRDRKRPSIEDIAAHPAEHGAEKEGDKAGAHGAGHVEAGKETAKKTNDFGKMINLDQFVVNLSTPGSVTPKFVKVNVSIEVPGVDAEAELASKMPQVRNVIIDLFNSKRPADLASVDGRDYLKEEIKNALNGFMVSGKVKGVFFTNFAFGG